MTPSPPLPSKIVTIRCEAKDHNNEKWYLTAYNKKTDDPDLAASGLGVITTVNVFPEFKDDLNACVMWKLIPVGVDKKKDDGSSKSKQQQAYYIVSKSPGLARRKYLSARYDGTITLVPDVDDEEEVWILKTLESGMTTFRSKPFQSNLVVAPSYPMVYHKSKEDVEQSVDTPPDATWKWEVIEATDFGELRPEFVGSTDDVDE